MKVARFHARAREEFLAEIDYYDQIQPGLGARFAAAIEKTVARALAFPKAGAPAAMGARRLIVKQFPFSVVYLGKPDGILIIAIAHQAQRPGYWHTRAI
ncbi:type II toxin-antitoxin system RelE/ParE family toxin [Pseudoduganella namucuonensis]|uniref:type II toxin-antitoxin system RelE/ParE family toxin n=1 Tax=Pseudoduganella namucuonensis TaxID=1035707 RepID=UPI000B873C4F|nr:type II toxin-antitoxin system RelE/ParE family toxin [Pseudoduganella namucuonensis]